MSAAVLFERAVEKDRAGDVDAAAAIYREIIAAAPDHVGALSNLGRIARAKGDSELAIDFYLRAAAHAAAPAEVHFNLGNAFRDLGRADEARQSYQRALALASDFSAAAEALRRLDASPTDPDALTQRAKDLFLKGDGDAAAALLLRAARAKPDDPTALQNLAFLYRSTGHYRKALAAYRRAAERDEAPIIRVEIANCLINMGRPDEARRELERLLPTPQGRRAGASSYLMSLLYDPNATPEFIRDEHRRLTAEWPSRFSERLHKTRRKRALRVGYLTADFFGDHPVAQFLSPLIEAHRDPAFGIESVAYDAKPRRDATAARMGALVAVRPIESLPDEAAADAIRKDDLDLLVDLSGHTSGRRLPVLGFRPAPVQACFIGYPSTTGVAGVDWLIGDDALFPRGAEALYTERLARLPQTFLAFAAPSDMAEPIRRRRAGPVVFGSLNHLPKINDAVLTAWARILAAAPDSLLLLQCAAFAEAESIADVAERFASKGVARARLRLEPPQRFAEAMRRYHEIDIALDPFPYNGGTTTAHALFMGVPVVALEGRYFCGRMGASLLRAANRSEWLAGDVDSYVATAVELAGRIERSEDVRGALLASNKTAPLFDVAGYAAAVAEMYRSIAS